ENDMVKDNMSILQIQAHSAKAALEDAGIEKDEVDGLFTAGLWGNPGIGSFPSIVLGEYLGINPRYTDTTNIGGASFEAHVGHATTAIKEKKCDVALILYGSTQKSEKSRNLSGRAPELIMQYDTPYGLPTPVGGYAMAAQRHMYQYGTTKEQLAEVAVATRKWATLNPNATKRDPISIKDVLESKPISDPLNLLDCCLVTDGAGAIVLVSEERAKKCKKEPVWVLGHGEAHSHWTIQAMPDLTVTSARKAGKDAFEMSGISHKQIDLVELYDSFTITPILTLESLGFCKTGEGGNFVSDQRTAPGGELPMNTNGGGLSYAHPGMYGIFLLIEAVRQLRNECDERQVSNAKTALVCGVGGQLASASVCILGRNK